MLWSDLEPGDMLMLNPEIIKISKYKSASSNHKFLKISNKNLIIESITPHDDALEIYFKDDENDYWIWEDGKFWSDVEVCLFKIVALKED